MLITHIFIIKINSLLLLLRFDLFVLSTLENIHFLRFFNFNSRQLFYEQFSENKFCKNWEYILLCERGELFLELRTFFRLFWCSEDVATPGYTYSMRLDGPTLRPKDIELFRCWVLEFSRVPQWYLGIQSCPGGTWGSQWCLGFNWISLHPDFVYVPGLYPGYLNCLVKIWLKGSPGNLKVPNAGNLFEILYFCVKISCDFCTMFYNLYLSYYRKIAPLQPKRALGGSEAISISAWGNGSRK